MYSVQKKNKRFLNALGIERYFIFSSMLAGPQTRLFSKIEIHAEVEQKKRNIFRGAISYVGKNCKFS